MSERGPSVRGGRRVGAALGALALTLAGLAFTFLGLDARAAAEPPGSVPAVLIEGAAHEVRGASLLSVEGEAAGVGALQRAIGAGLASAGAALLTLLASRRGRPVAQRVIGSALGLGALAGAIALAAATGADVESAGAARDAAVTLAPAVAIPALLAAARAA